MSSIIKNTKNTFSTMSRIINKSKEFRYYEQYDK